MLGKGVVSEGSELKVGDMSTEVVGLGVGSPGARGKRNMQDVANPSSELGENDSFLPVSRANSSTEICILCLLPHICVLEEGETLKEHLKVRGIRLLRTSLMIPMLFITPDGVKIPIKALVDPGCETNLVRKGLIPQENFHPAERGVRLVTANGSILGGGNRQANLKLYVQGYQVGSDWCKTLTLPTVCYEAEISVDIILSFTWLHELNLDIRTRQYGLQTNQTPQYFIPGVKEQGIAQG